MPIYCVAYKTYGSYFNFNNNHIIIPRRKTVVIAVGRFISVSGVVKYYLKENCHKLKMYVRTPKVTTTNR